MSAISTQAKSTQAKSTQAKSTQAEIDPAGFSPTRLDRAEFAQTQSAGTRLSPGIAPPEDQHLGLDLAEASNDAALLRVYRQLFGVLAQEAGAMTPNPNTIDIDEALLGAFANSGTTGLSVEQANRACSAWPVSQVTRRFEVLRDYGALVRVVDRAHERHYRAAFAPYVMVLFLRRMAHQGGQSEVHQLLSMEHANIRSSTATSADAQAALAQLTNMFRLLGNDLAILAAGATSEILGESAQLLWGNRELLSVADEFHQTAIKRWPQLDRQCTELRLALGTYVDAIKAAAGRLIDQAGHTQALGLLPVETWRTFARNSSAEELAEVLGTFPFDAPAPWFSPTDLLAAVESSGAGGPLRLPPPRPDQPAANAEHLADPIDDTQDLRTQAEQLLGAGVSIPVHETLRSLGDWRTARRVLAELTACHHHPDLPYELLWTDHLDISDQTPTWVSAGTFQRTVPAGPAHD